MAEKIVIDAGHGGSNPGAVYNGRRESDDVLRLAMAVGSILEDDGYDIIYTRTTDATQSVGQKAAIANEEGADLFISLHRNAAEYPGQYTGVQTLIYDESGIKKEMAEKIDANLAALGFRDAGISVRPNLVVLNATQMPALLVEVGFIDSDVDNRLFDTKFHAIAQAIADGIEETLNDAEKVSSAQVKDATNVTLAASEGAADDEGMLKAAHGMDREDGLKEILYRVQAGAFTNRENADNLLLMLENDGISAYIIYQDGLYKVQIGAYNRLSNAIAMEREVREKGYSTYITT